MGEVVVAVSDVDDGLNERLDDEIYAFNAAATGLMMANCCAWRCAGVAGSYLRGSVVGHGVAVATSSCFGYAPTSAGPGWARGSWPRRRRRCVGAAVNRWR